jgi:hypothetical protein
VISPNAIRSTAADLARGAAFGAFGGRGCPRAGLIPRNVFIRLGIHSRRELTHVLPNSLNTQGPGCPEGLRA